MRGLDDAHAARARALQARQLEREVAWIENGGVQAGGGERCLDVVGVGEIEVHAAADARLVIPMRKGLRSLNVAMAAAMAAGEAMRQIASARPAGLKAPASKD